MAAELLNDRACKSLAGDALVRYADEGCLCGDTLRAGLRDADAEREERLLVQLERASATEEACAVALAGAEKRAQYNAALISLTKH